MELKKPSYGLRTVYPIPGDENFYVKLRRLTDAERNAIYARHDYNPSFAKKATPGRTEKVLRDIVTTAVEGVYGGTEDGAPLPPHDDETKLRLTVVTIETDGEEKTLWMVCDELAAQQEKAERKNSPRE